MNILHHLKDLSILLVMERDNVSRDEKLRSGHGQITWKGQLLLICLYLIAIVLANLLVAWLGPKIVIFNAFVLIGLDLTTRDFLHEAWHHRGLFWKMLLLIGAGSIITWILNHGAGRIAMASFIAFCAAGIMDTMIYTILFKRIRFIKINGSNILASLTDSILFPTIAFGAFMPGIIFGQFAAKVLGGFLWSLLIVKVRRGK